MNLRGAHLRPVRLSQKVTSPALDSVATHTCRPFPSCGQRPKGRVSRMPEPEVNIQYAFATTFAHEKVESSNQVNDELPS